MSRMHAHTHGKSHSVRPVSINVPNWLTQDYAQVSSLILQLSKEGLVPSEIGVRLRDHHGIPLAKPIIGKSITKVLSDSGISREMPEDLDQLVKKALGLQRHLRSHNTDHRNVRSLELIESKIHRLSRYYKEKGKLQKNWKYATVIAQLE